MLENNLLLRIHFNFADTVGVHSFGTTEHLEVISHVPVNICGVFMMGRADEFYGHVAHAFVHAFKMLHQFLLIGKLR